jgi:protocatechuate 3,4-dioxygenase beta subunit
VQQGLLLRLGINVSEITSGACAPMSGAYVDVWHCNASGVYSDVAAQGTTGRRFLRGYQVTDSHGNVRFLTIYPGYYPGRTVHIHFRVRRFSGTTVTFNFVSQLYFNDTVTDGIFQRVAPYNSRPARTTRNTNDNIYSSVMLVRLSDNGSHAIASFNAVINSVPGLRDGGISILESDDEHADDLGGGTPPLDIE